MDQIKSLPGLDDVTMDLAELRRQVMDMHTFEERLEGIPPARLVARLTPAQRAAGLTPAQLVEGLTAEDRAELLKLLLAGADKAP